MIFKLAILASLALMPQQPGGGNSGDPPAPQVIEVHLVDKGGGQWRFEPAAIEAAPGDMIRFIQDDIVPHNVEFKQVPSGAKLGAAKMGPFLLEQGATYDLAIDGRFPPGEYAFVCTPHEMMGMKATLTVASPVDGGLQ